MQIGILLGTFARPTLEADLDAVKACGLDCVQLSMDCAGLPPMPDEIAPELSGRIRREAAARGITIASLQGTFNMCHPDAPASAARAAAPSGAGRGLPAARHVEDSPLHRHARPREHVAAPPGQRFARGLARHVRLRARGGGHRQARRA